MQEQHENGKRNTYVYDPNEAYSPLARIDHQAQSRQGDILWFSTDLNGAPLEVTDEQGAVRWSGQYGSLGEVKRQTEGFQRTAQGSALAHQPLRYAGQYADAETGLHYNLFRYYDPQLGQFTVQDPIGLAGGWNLYQYAPNPLGWIDPLGLSSCSGEQKLYRGVSVRHPEIENARKCIIKPAKPDADLTPEQHAEGGMTGESQYVSWTPNKDLALQHATKEGPGGVLLEVPTGAPPDGAGWSWGWSHINQWNEIEMLQMGTRTGAKVTIL